MTVSNRVTLAQLDEMAEGDVAALPVAMLAMLLEDVAVAKTTAKRLDDKLTAALHARFGEPARKARHAAGKDAGRVRFDADDEYVVVSDLPQITDWDQAELGKAAETVRSWGENETDYLSVVRKVAESKYKAWPASIRKVFESARTVHTGKPSYEIIKREAA